MLIHNILDYAAQRFPDKEAVWFQNKWMTFGELQKKSKQVGRFLRESGIKRSDRVALIYENSFDYIIAYYGILSADAVVVSLATDVLPESLKNILNHCEVSGLVVSHNYLKSSIHILNQIATLKIIISDLEQDAERELALTVESATFYSIYSHITDTSLDAKSIDVDLSSIIYTSGSTGEPKGVMLSHLNIVNNVISIAQYLQLKNDDRMMVVLPFHYVYGKSLLNTHFLVGGSLVIDNRFVYPSLILDTMKRMQVTGFAGVPSTFKILLNHSSLREYLPFENLRYLTQAGGHMVSSVQEQVVQTFEPAKLIVMYGATELAPRLTWLPPERWEEKKGSIGIPIPNTEAFVADENGCRLPPFTEGEIVGRGSNVMMGYWKDPKSTELVIKNGTYFTGDIGYADNDGFIYVVGRSKDMLKIGGKRVSAKEIEDAILEYNMVDEVAVIGVPDPLLGEVAKAFIVFKKSQEVEEIIIKQFLSAKLPFYKIPKYFKFLTSLPKNESGKVLKPLLVRDVI